MSSQIEEPLVPNHVGFNDAPTFLDAESKAQSPTENLSKSLSKTSSNSKSERVEQVNIGNGPGRRNSIVREKEVGDHDEEDSVGGSIGGEGQKAMREGKQVI